MAFQQNAFQHNAFQVGIAGAAPPVTLPAGTPSGGQWLNPWKKTPTIVFEQQNLLLTTLALVVVPRAALFTKQQVRQQELGFVFNNLLLTTLTVVQADLPPGKQSFDSKLWKYSATQVFEDQNKHLTLFNPGFPVGQQNFPEKGWKLGPTIVYEQQDLLTTLLFQEVVFPVGKQYFDSVTWKYKPTIVFEQQNTLPLFTPVVVYPVGKQYFDAILQKYKTQIVQYDQNSHLTLFNPGFPVGDQLFDAKLPKFQTSTYFEYQNLLNTVLIPPVAGAGPTLYYDITTGRLALLLVDTTSPKIIMLL